MQQNQGNLSPQLRAAKFSAMTRENIQTLPALTATEGQTVSFNLPKARLLSRIQLLVDAEVRVTHATETSYTPATFAPYTLLRRVQVDMNNGFSPFKVSGDELYMYNYMYHNAHVLQRSTTNENAAVFQQIGASAAGMVNRIRFVADLPIALNSRDPIGLIMLQNEELVVTVTIDVDEASKLLLNPAGYTVELVKMSITPVTHTFTIPIVPEAIPDLSVLKLVHSTIKDIIGGGITTVKLPVGMTYRKLMVWIENAEGRGLKDTELQGDFEIVFNQADIPYRVNPAVLRVENTRNFGHVMPQGLFIFDWSDQGQTNYGGSRDYIDTERLTEFWLKFTTMTSGKVKLVYETLSKLRVA